MNVKNVKFLIGGFIYEFLFVIMRRTIKEENHELRKKISLQEAEFADLPYCHDGQESACFVDQSPVCCPDHDLRGRGMYQESGLFRGIIDNAPDANDIDISPLGYATFLYDGDGNQLRKLTAPSSNRLPGLHRPDPGGSAACSRGD